MTESIHSQIDKVRASIISLEAQRAVIGDEAISTSLATSRQRLTDLEKTVVAQILPIEERLMVTTLLIDIVGSTSLAEKLDPEEWRLSLLENVPEH